MISVAWGTSSLRAYRVKADGAISERRESARGILSVAAGEFPAVLEATISDWLGVDKGPVMLSGMVGSRQGWREAAYVECPTGAQGIAAAMLPLQWSERRAWLVPGLSCRDGAGVPDVMRGEEAQLLGVLDELPDATALVCLPGSHSKWVRIVAGRILSFATHLTGEAYAALLGHTILGRMADGEAEDAEWFERGVDCARGGRGLLHDLFGVRTRGLFGELPAAATAAYLSGLLIGHELHAALGEHDHAVFLLGAPQLSERYARALRVHGREAKTLPSDAVVRGHQRLLAAIQQQE